MSRRVSVLALATVLLLLVGCGSSKHASTSSATGTSPGSSAPVATGPVPGGRRTTSSGGSAPTGSTPGSGGAATNARVPATFVIRPGGKLAPPVVSSPAFIAVQLTVVSADGSPHRVLLRTPHPHALNVPAGGRASTLVPGLRAGRYPLEVDGAIQGSLMIGGEPGP